jgi:hypothetical protein
MGATRHEKSFVDYDQPYEQNIIGLKGIVYFGIGLFLLIVITFGLMWALQNVLEDNAKIEKTRDNPMAMSDRERLPPEPRLQAAPGFWVDSPEGRKNFELREPQAEYRELRKQWENEWKQGVRDSSTGAVTALPIDAAKEAVLGQNMKARTDENSIQSAEQTRTYIIDSSSGRVATLKRR